MNKKINKIFNNINVLDLSAVLAGPSTSQFFGELGANIIKIENLKTKGDVTRSWLLKDEIIKKDTITSYYSSCNSTKKSLAIDIKNEKGLSIIHQLVKKSDIIIQSYKPGDAEKLKVDYNTLKKINDKIIYAQITGYGLNIDRAGYDAIIQAEAGFQEINGDDKPTKMPVALMDILTSHQLKQGILLGLLKKEKFNIGSNINVSLFESGVSSLANQATSYLIGNQIPKRLGSDHPSIVPYGSIFKCKDNKDITLAVGSDKQFENLCKCLNDNDKMYNDKNFKTNKNRVINRDLVKSKLNKLFLNFNSDDIINKLHQTNVPCGIINNVKDVFKQDLAKNLIINDKNNKPVGLKQIAFHIEEDQEYFEKKQQKNDDEFYLTPPPQYGEHTIDILKNELNYNDDEINKLKNENIIDILL